MSFKIRFTLAGSITLLLFSGILVRLAYLQLYCASDLAARAKQSHHRHQIDQDPRGAILDRHGAVLAVSIEGGACFADPKLVAHPTQAAEALADLLHRPVSEVRAKLTQKKRFVWLARRLDPATAEAVRALKMRGIQVLAEQKRFYPEESFAAHTLGVVGDNHQGLSGVELTADSWLRAKSMPSLFKDWGFRKKATGELNQRDDWPSHSVVLTLDRTLQTIADQELSRQIKMSRAKSGVVIIQNPHSGDILAMASYPTFDPNVWGMSKAPGHYGPETLKNSAVERVFEPGSTYKIVTAAAAIEERKIKPDDLVFCEYGRWKIEGRYIKDHEKDGQLTFWDVIGHSSNIGTAKVAMRLGQQGLYRYSRAFGFGMPSGCGLPGDGAGILRQVPQWSGASLETIAFGQEVGVTALQMVSAYSALANGGVLLEPRLFHGLVDQNGDYREWSARQPIRKVVSNETAATLRAMLRHVVDDGTGKAAQVPGLSVAGKTGTAQKINPETRQYDSQRYIASFCGFAPAENPKLVIGVFLDEPQASIWGGSEAAPLFSRIVRAAASYLKWQTGSIGPLAVSRTIPRT